MSMSWIRTLSAAAGVSIAVIAGPAAASCLENVNLSGPPAQVDYNPFQAATEMSSGFTVVAERRRAAQGQPRVLSVDLQFLPDSVPFAGSGITSYDLASGGVSVVSPTGTAFGGGGSWVTIDFNNNQPASSLPIRLVVPARQDAIAGSHQGQFGLAWRCTLSNGQTESGQSPGFLWSTIDVENRVRAVAVGGGTAGTLLVNPATQEATGGLAIRSTGPFTIAASSPTGFEMRLNNAGGASVPDDQRARYRFKVAGEVLSRSGASLSCARTGLSGATLNVRTELRDDPKALRAGNYMDVVTIDVTPQVFAGAPAGC
jgi:hypothetical protein